MFPITLTLNSFADIGQTASFLVSLENAMRGAGAPQQVGAMTASEAALRYGPSSTAVDDQHTPAPEVAPSGKSSRATAARSERTASAEAPAPAAPEKTAAASSPAAASAAAGAPASTAATSAPATAGGDAVDYPTLSKAVLKLYNTGPDGQVAAAQIAKDLGFDSFKAMKGQPNENELFARAHAAVVAKLGV